LHLAEFPAVSPPLPHALHHPVFFSAKTSGKTRQEKSFRIVEASDD
jgi:hypothetical protein